MDQQGNNPGMRFHAAGVLRGLGSVIQSSLSEGRFGRMFRNLPSLEPADGKLEALAKTMFEPEDTGNDDEESEFDNPNIAAGITYLGQFIDHDLTFDPASRLQRQNDPDALHNFRTPRFDLDSVYGRGPDDEPFLYEPDGIKFRIGENAAGQDDLPRTAPDGTPRRALIGDPRNDENVIVSQLHLAFLKYHNRVVEDLQAKGLPEGRLFEEARRIVRWHYQWLVINSFLRTTVGFVPVDDILQMDHIKVGTQSGTRDIAIRKVDLKFFHWDNRPFIPVEFSVAAYRFGHSLVRPEYELNDTAPPDIPIFAPNPGPLGDLRGFRELPEEFQIEWHRFFKFPGTPEELQRARLIDTKLAIGLKKLPKSVVDKPPVSLAERNLKRGKALGLPSGQAVARRMGLPDDLVLGGDSLGLPDDLKDTFGERTPLWYYILREAGELQAGQCLGPVGGRIVAEVFLGLLQGDPFSYLRVQPNWRPEPNEFGADGDGDFRMRHLLGHAGVTI